MRTKAAIVLALLVAAAAPASAQDTSGGFSTGTPANSQMGRALPCTLGYHTAFKGFPAVSYLDVLNNTGATIPAKSVIYVTRIPGFAGLRYEIDVRIIPDQAYVRIFGPLAQPWTVEIVLSRTLSAVGS